MQNLSATLELRIAFCKEGGHSFPYVLARICNHDGERCIVERVFEGRIQSLAHHVFGEPNGKRCSFRDGPCKLERSTREYCDMIAANAPLTMRAAKRIIREVSAAKYDGETCAAWVKECFDSEDYKEGRKAFMEKRKPVFKGR